MPGRAWATAWQSLGSVAAKRKSIDTYAQTGLTGTRRCSSTEHGSVLAPLLGSSAANAAYNFAFMSSLNKTQSGGVGRLLWVVEFAVFSTSTCILVSVRNYIARVLIIRLPVTTLNATLPSRRCLAEPGLLFPQGDAWQSLGYCLAEPGQCGRGKKEHRCATLPSRRCLAEPGLLHDSTSGSVQPICQDCIRSWH